MDMQMIILVIECILFILAVFVMGFAIGLALNRKSGIVEGYHEAMNMRAESIIAFCEMYLKDKQRGDKDGAEEKNGSH